MKNNSVIEEYIASLPPDVQLTLSKLHTIVTKSVPNAVEYIGYGMPGYKLNGKPLLYFSAFKNHIGVYPTPSGVKVFATELTAYKTAKGSIQFPLDKPFPFDLFTNIVKYRAKEL